MATNRLTYMGSRTDTKAAATYKPGASLTEMYDLAQDNKGKGNTKKIKKIQKDIGRDVRKAGGSMYDIAAAYNRDGKAFTDDFLSQPLDEERAKLLKRINDNMSTLDTILVSAGRTATNIGRAIGIAKPESIAVRGNFKRLAKEQPIAATVGEALPFLVPGMGVGAIASLPVRIGAAGALGAAEGGIIAKGRDEDVQKGVTIGAGIGAGIEAFFPILGRAAKSVFSRITGKAARGDLLTPDGLPSDELQDALDSAGVDFNDLVDDAVAEMKGFKAGTDPEQALRAARFEAQKMPTTTGDITQKHKQQAMESRLSSMASGEGGEPLRQLRLQQSERFKEGVNTLVDNLGVPQGTGDRIKEVLKGREKLLKTEKRELYQQVFDANPDIKKAPIITTTIRDALPEKEILDDLSISDAGLDAVDEVKRAMARFGIDTSEEALTLLEKRGITPEPLTAGNYDRFRKTLIEIEKNNKGNQVFVMTIPIKEALDNEATLMADAIKHAGIEGGDFMDTLEKARGLHKQVKTEFSPQAIAGRLITKRRDGADAVEASQVVDEIFRKPEYIARTIKSLKASGEEGMKRIGDLQATAVLRMLEDALAAPSRKIDGVEVIGGNQFAKSYSKFAKDEKLAILFANNKKALRELDDWAKTGKDVNPSSLAMVKGSGPVNLDILNIIKRSSSLPIYGHVVSVLSAAWNAASSGVDVSKSMRGKPQYKRAASLLEKSFPAIASSFGIASVDYKKEE